VAQRIHLAPALSRKLVHVPLGLDYPYWVEDPGLDIDYHVRDLALPAPGSDRQLAEKVAQIVPQRLDQSRPLWELYVIEGLEGGRVAVVFKLHHAAVDGISALELHEMLFDRSPDGRQVPPRAACPGGAGAVQLGHAWARAGEPPRQPVRAQRSTARSLPYLDHLMPFRITPGIGTVSRTTRRLGRLLRVGGEGMSLEASVCASPRRCSTSRSLRIAAGHSPRCRLRTPSASSSTSTSRSTT
jgi:WS/DGAT/MGAT family acyltransferase